MNNAQNLGAPMRSTSMARPQMQHFVPEQGVCAKEIDFVVDNGSIDYVSFVGGCEGNHKAIASMVEGMNVQFVLDRFSGITCGSKTTSCVDQFCQALREYMETQSK